MQALSKRVKHLLNEYAGEAYERELHRELSKLDGEFQKWREGQLSSGEMGERIHQYEIGPSRELHKSYNDGRPDMAVAYAVVTGLLSRDEVAVEVLQALETAIGFYQGLKDKGELSEPGT